MDVKEGDTLTVKITGPSKNPHEGIGFLEDGILVLVRQGDRHINKTVTVIVRKVLTVTDSNGVPDGRQVVITDLEKNQPPT